MMRDFLARFRRRPRVLNVAHALGVYEPYSGTTRAELECLARNSAGAGTAIEIGTHMGVSAAVIAGSMAANGMLYCVDPWPRRGLAENPCYSICVRELKRRGLLQRTTLIRALSKDAAPLLPPAEFFFIDGDHSEQGIAIDWAIIQEKSQPGSVICLHDTSVPPNEPERRPGSVHFFETTISRDKRFELMERVHSMNVLRRLT